jgi:SAM-dependent methyltransferase
VTTLAFLSTKLGQFTYFSQQVGDPDWSGKEVLDFGGNIGNILRDPASTIDQERYWCLDVVKDSIEQGKLAFARAHWIFYNRYCFFFNPHGVVNLPLPDVQQRFDYIIAYSVFANTTPSDMVQMVKQLENLLASDGTLAFTFIDPYHFPWPGEYDGNNFKYRVELEIERGNVSAIDGRNLIRRTTQADWFMLVNAKDLYIETESIPNYEPAQQKTCHVFHTEKYMKTLFPHASIQPPVNSEMQHCCIIRKS